MNNFRVSIAILASFFFLTSQTSLAAPATKDACEAVFNKGIKALQEMSNDNYMDRYIASKPNLKSLRPESRKTVTKWMAYAREAQIATQRSSQTKCFLTDLAKHVTSINDSLSHLVTLGLLTQDELLDDANTITVVDDSNGCSQRESNDKKNAAMKGCTEKNYYGRYPKGGGCTYYGCFPRNANCNPYGCHPEAGSCNSYGCSATGKCNYNGCLDRIEHLDPKTQKTKPGFLYTCED